MAKILVIGSPKGGVAKSTEAIMLAVIASRFLGLKVGLLDADPNHTALNWHGRSEKNQMPFDVFESAHNHEQLRDLRRSDNHDLYIVDLEGGAEGSFAQILKGRHGRPVADLLVMPAPHLGPDLEATTKAIHSYIPEGLPYLVVLARIPPRSEGPATDVRDELREDLKWNVADTIVKSYAVYDTAWQRGCTVIDMPGENSYARLAERDQIRLAIEVFEPLGFDVEALRESVREDDGD